MRYSLSGNQLVIAGALFTIAFGNLAFFRHQYHTFADQPWVYAHMASVGVVFMCVTIVLLALLSLTRAIKPVFSVYFVIAAFTAYFMDTFNVIIDHDMIANVVQTHPGEALDLATPRLALYLLLLGVIPLVLLWKTPVRSETVSQMLRNRGLLVVGALVLAAALILSSSGFYASFFREHKPLRYYSNPLAPLQGAVRYASLQFKDANRPLQRIGEDARLPTTDTDRELVIMVVGETARSDRFSLNGYARETNPLLADETVASLRNVSACGTSTAISVPCMFALVDRRDFDGSKARSTENVLDVLQRAGVNVLWRDNNSDSKGVAVRVPQQDFRSPEMNPVCDVECRDEGMLEGVQAFIDSHPNGDILVVLHQMGSHGPAYYKRYPDSFRRFAPTCDTSELDSCNEEQIGNTYDNTLLYTDYFLSKVIALLRGNDERYETAMIYVSDHGESLGEKGLYLHGLPYMFAPDTQTRVPAIFWFGRHFDGASIESMQQLVDEPYSHDNVFHTLLGIFEVESDVYRKDMDIVHQAAMQAGGPERG